MCCSQYFKNTFLYFRLQTKELNIEPEIDKNNKKKKKNINMPSRFTKLYQLKKKCSKSPNQQKLRPTRIFVWIDLLISSI
mmetsp:Transcript_17123/g.19392  ORF Transcript_17123/g.19392 Transcript_17123/m.19392 type:complete len:80 (+) Transcript_17123:1387-1626(+)